MLSVVHGAISFAGNPKACDTVGRSSSVDLSRINFFGRDTVNVHLEVP
jgi:hypothetical protein